MRNLPAAYRCPKDSRIQECAPSFALQRKHERSHDLRVTAATAPAHATYSWLAMPPVPLCLNIFAFRRVCDGRGRTYSHVHHVSPSIQSTAPSGGRSARTIERSTDFSPLRGRHASLVSIVLPRSMTSFAWNRPECEKSNRIFCDAMVFPSEFEDKILPV